MGDILETPEQPLELYDQIVRAFNLAIKNSALYTFDHPLCKSSIDNFKATLGKWFAAKEKLELGVSQDNIFFNGQTIKEGDSRYTEIAEYLHQRGIIALTFVDGITMDELLEFFGFIKNDRRAVREKGGVLKNISSTPHLIIREIDYSELLKKGKKEPTTEEEEVWQSLFKVVEQGDEGELPESKMEFLEGFFDDTKESARVLNKVYKEAVNSLQDDATVKEVQETVGKVCRYFEKHAKPEAKKMKVKLIEVVSQLHPDLVNMLFEKTVINDEDFDLAEEITEDFSDSYIAGFIEDLISNEDTFNENLLKVFDKLAPGTEKADNIVSMVADKLFSKRVLNPVALSKMQMSIKEIFTSHPESSFMNQMHKITVDAVVNKKIDTLVYVARLSPLINKFVQSVEEGQLKKEEIWLLLNVLWLENNSEEFEKFGEKIVKVLPELLDSKEVSRIKEIMEFFTEKQRPEQKENNEIVAATRKLVDRIATSETKDSLISFIPEADTYDLENIVDILVKSKTDSARLLVDAYVLERNPAHINKFRFVISKMQDEVVKETIDRIEYGEPLVVRNLFKILTEYASDKEHLVSKKLISHKDPQIRLEALEVFNPEPDGEMGDLFTAFKKEKNEEVQKKIASVLIRTKNEKAIGNLFKYVQRNWFKRKFLVKLIELCGLMRSEETFSHLKRLFYKKCWFTTKRWEDVKVTTVTSLGRIGTPEAQEIIDDGLKDKNKRVREMCEIIVKLKAEGGEEKKDKEGQNGSA
ncbi:HEAT repeat domain-containing protein [Candidatus Omnitrophota bacterium]